MAYRIGVDLLHIWKPYTFPSPFEVIKTIVELVRDNTIGIAVVASIKRLVLSYILSLIIGISLGLIIARFKYLEENLSPLILGLQTLPSICWLPFSILWFGIDERAIIFITTIGSIFAISIGTESAIKNVDPLYIKAAKTMGAKGFKLYLNVIIPAALPAIIVGMKQGWTFAWRALMAGEMMSATKGLGQVLTVGRQLADISQVMAVMIVIIVLGLVLDKILFGKIEANLRYKFGLDKNL